MSALSTQKIFTEWGTLGGILILSGKLSFMTQWLDYVRSVSTLSATSFCREFQRLSSGAMFPVANPVSRKRGRSWRDVIRNALNIRRTLGCTCDTAMSGTPCSGRESLENPHGAEIAACKLPFAVTQARVLAHRLWASYRPWGRDASLLVFT